MQILKIIQLKNTQLCSSKKIRNYAAARKYATLPGKAKDELVKALTMAAVVAFFGTVVGGAFARPADSLICVIISREFHLSLSHAILTESEAILNFVNYSNQLLILQSYNIRGTTSEMEIQREMIPS